MFEVFRNAWKVAELRKKILYTLFIIVIFRLGSCVFVPFLDNAQIAAMLNQGDGGSRRRPAFQIPALEIRPPLSRAMVILLHIQPSVLVFTT